MYCIKCSNENTKVIDSRVSDDGKSIRRRRECENCNYRFTTFEKLEIINLVVVKSWNKKEKYSRTKLEGSILKAINKRNLSMWTVNDMIRILESKWMSKEEISSKEIWKYVLSKLVDLDEVAYIRYASVHLNFETAKDFTEFITEKINEK